MKPTHTGKIVRISDGHEQEILTRFGLKYNKKTGNVVPKQKTQEYRLDVDSVKEIKNDNASGS